jgi:uncharacterized LabA/DUF88 family protein
MDKTIVLIDGGFLSKLQKHLGEKGKRIKIDHIKFSKLIAKKQGLFFKHMFYYYAPPFQDAIPTEEQKIRKGGYEKFKAVMLKNKEITYREGRVQRLFNADGTENYKQKGVDTLVVMDMMDLEHHHPDVKTVILIACDSDFVPIIKHLRKHGIDVILVTYFERKRDTSFSRCNELMQAVSKCSLIDASDLKNSLPDYMEI